MPSVVAVLTGNAMLLAVSPIMPLPEVTAAAWGAMVEVSPQQRSAYGWRAAGSP
jgi:hypothetical protein